MSLEDMRRLWTLQDQQQAAIAQRRAAEMQLEFYVNFSRVLGKIELYIDKKNKEGENE